MMGYKAMNFKTINLNVENKIASVEILKDSAILCNASALSPQETSVTEKSSQCSGKSERWSNKSFTSASSFRETNAMKIPCCLSALRYRCRPS